MKTSKIVKHMCLEELSNVDIRAICKARGFSLKESSVPEVLENFLLSHQGIQESMATLSKDEVILLHMLAEEPGTVDVSFFDRIYGPGQRSYWTGDTFNQKYGDVFKKVKKFLVQRGILFFMEEKGAWNKKSKLERMIFKFPPEFKEYLPCQFTNILGSSSPGNEKQFILREKLMEVTGNRGPKTSKKIAEEFQLALVDGELYIGKNIFSENHLLEWQRKCWADALEKEHKLDGADEAFSVIRAVHSMLSQLKPGEWASHEELKQAVNIFCYDFRSKAGMIRKNEKEKQYDTKLICDLGWRWGCIAKNSVQDQTGYSLTAYSEDIVLFDDCMCPDEKHTMIINLETIPFKLLERLNSICDFKRIDSQLTAAPNTIRLGRVFGDLSQEPLTEWLSKNIPAFRDALSKIEASWGRHIIHEDLLVAKVKDLGLKMTIKKSFSDPAKLVFLPNDYIAFPKRVLCELDALINKSGFAVKMVESG